MDKTLPTDLKEYPSHATDTIRFGDTDRLGHVNNAAFCTFFETGRVTLLYRQIKPIALAGTAFVIARIAIDFRAEINWPGRIEIGTRVADVGNRSLGLEQALFQDGRCVATAESVMVLIDESTRRSTLLPAAVIEALKEFSR